mmetsp:Transcript_45361/g.73060  ORF Transcript_45361/g.73060 Transcript_45361/m.73060 type:complete len:202 (-) Transcript_45361:383-988(-)
MGVCKGACNFCGMQLGSRERRSGAVHLCRAGVERLRDRRGENISPRRQSATSVAHHHSLVQECRRHVFSRCRSYGGERRPYDSLRRSHSRRAFTRQLKNLFAAHYVAETISQRPRQARLRERGGGSRCSSRLRRTHRRCPLCHGGGSALLVATAHVAHILLCHVLDAHAQCAPVSSRKWWLVLRPAVAPRANNLRSLHRCR